MSKEDVVKLRGIVKEIYPGSKFLVELCDDNDKFVGNKIIATIAGKIRMNSIKILKEDKVDVEVSIYDLSNGRIVWRYR